MSAMITLGQRDTLYDQILDRRSGIELAIRSEDFDNAERFGREYCDDLRLLLDDLGLGDSNGEPVELTAPPEVLRRVLPRLLQIAVDHTSGMEPEGAEIGELKKRNRLVSEACVAVPASLDGTQAIDRQRPGSSAMSRLPGRGWIRGAARA
jgi:hypothetical protein